MTDKSAGQPLPNMKRLLPFILLLALACSAQSASVVRAIITITNAVTTNGMTLVVNGSTRTWTNDVSSTPGSLIATNNSIGGNATNLYNHLSFSVFSPAHFLTRSNNNVVALRGGPGETMTVAASGWATVTYKTQTIANSQSGPLILPFSEMTSTNREQFASWDLEAFLYATNTIATNAGPMVNFATKTVGEVHSNKTHRAFRLEGGYSTNLQAKRMWFDFNGETNGIAFSSATNIGAWITPDAFGVPLLIQASDGDAAEPSDPAHILTLKWAQAIFPGLTSTNDWFGTNFFRGKAWFFEPLFTTNGYASSQTNIGGYDSNRTYTAVTVSGSTNQWTGDIAEPDISISGLANTNNVIDPGSGIYLDLSGPSANFNVTGILNGRTGRRVVLRNKTGFTIRLSHQSGTTGDTNRIDCGTGGDVVSTNQAGYLPLRYRNSRWELMLGN
jgi:hypothetical protein